jgi:hypothetical protein
MTYGTPPETSLPVGAGWARERLWLGMSNVGLWVVLAAGVVVFGAPSLGFSAWDPILWALLVVALQFPLDVVGGFWLPRRHGRSSETLAAWGFRWGRAAIVHAGLSAAALTSATALYQVGGVGLAIAGAALGILGLIGLQGPWLWATSGLRTSALPSSLTRVAQDAGLSPDGVKVVDAQDGGFVGGWVGLPGAETLVIPRAWTEPGAADLLDVQLRRRAAARRTGQRARGTWLGAGFSLVGVAAGLLVFGAATPEDAVRAAALATLWSFVGLLALPTPSRRGVLAVDAAAVQQGLSTHRFARVAPVLDLAQEGEPARSDLVESIFHPVPALQRRIQAVDQPPHRGGAWHAARMALLTSQAAACPLARAVHCNAGRPELWAVYPGD